MEQGTKCRTTLLPNLDVWVHQSVPVLTPETFPKPERVVKRTTQSPNITETPNLLYTLRKQ